MRGHAAASAYLQAAELRVSETPHPPLRGTFSRKGRRIVAALVQHTQSAALEVQQFVVAGLAHLFDPVRIGQEGAADGDEIELVTLHPFDQAVQ